MKRRRTAPEGGNRGKTPVAVELARPPQSPPRTGVLIAIICVILAVAILALYAQTFRFDYVAYDDDQFVYQNPMVIAGLSPAGLAWALTTTYAANWYPLTWISYQLDCQIFGLNPGAEHAINVSLHLANTLLLFFALLRMTKQPWRSALVAAIFALHPLHVESVAWIAERKDVLGTLFAMLMLLFYIRYVRAPSAGKYIYVALAFALGLMAKPMVVTWPFVLLLLDFWPLRRVGWPMELGSLARLSREKAPLFVMTAIGSAVTYLAQRNYGAVESLDYLPWSARVANILVSYLLYMAKAVWPVDLAAFYPSHPHDVEIVVASALVLIAITVAAVIRARLSPWLLVGWLWYLGMLVPVIGIVQVGWQAMADRYTYAPLVGLSIALVWTIADAVERSPLLQRGTIALSIVVLSILAVAAYRQAGYWKNSHALFEHALAVTSGNYVMENNMGLILGQEGQSAESMAAFHRAIAISPVYADAYANLGRELMVSGQMNEASPPLLRAIRLNPRLEDAQASLGVLLASEGKFGQAEQHLEEAVRLSPTDSYSQSNLCSVLQYLTRPAEAVAHCAEALKLQPDSPAARLNLASAFAAQGKRAEAIRELTTVLQKDPTYAPARAALDDLQRGR